MCAWVVAFCLASGWVPTTVVDDGFKCPPGHHLEPTGWIIATLPPKTEYHCVPDSMCTCADAKIIYDLLDDAE